MTERHPRPAAIAGQDPGQSWATADADIRRWVSAVVDACNQQLDAGLRAVHLHGSLATGSYRRAKSDVDLLAVSRDPLDEDCRWRLARSLVALSDLRPTVGDLELSVITEPEARAVRHPMPFEIQFNETRAARIRAGEPAAVSNGRDGELTANVASARARGVTLAGASAQDIYGPIPWSNFLAAVLDDVDWILRDDNILGSPVYGILNACRVVQALTQGEGANSDKEEGAVWALAHLPLSLHQPIADALACYRSDQPVTTQTRRTGGLAWDEPGLRSWRDAMAAEVARLRAP